MLVIFAFQGMCTLHLGCQIYWCCAADGEMEGSGRPAAVEDRGQSEPPSRDADWKHGPACGGRATWGGNCPRRPLSFRLRKGTLHRAGESGDPATLCSNAAATEGRRRLWLTLAFVGRKGEPSHWREIWGRGLLNQGQAEVTLLPFPYTWGRGLPQAHQGLRRTRWEASSRGEASSGEGVGVHRVLPRDAGLTGLQALGRANPGHQGTWSQTASALSPWGQCTGSQSSTWSRELGSSWRTEAPLQGHLEWSDHALQTLRHRESCCEATAALKPAGAHPAENGDLQDGDRGWLKF